MIHPGDDEKAAADCLACDDPKNQETLAMVAGVLAGNLIQYTCPFTAENLRKEWQWGWKIGYSCVSNCLLI
ncbi:MAG: hypothetical protein KAS66_05495 [Candidatus Omnitrophica bacterium]|nr:hypothetical protein [Candidatus Omnitrophota bacterium]